MALTVETGTGSASSEAYASVADATTYHADRGNAAWAALASDTVREQALRRAADYITQTYRRQWKGVRVNTVQALDWPRYGVYLEPVLNGAVSAFPHLLASDVVPPEVEKANIELALRAAAGELLADIEAPVRSEKVGPIEVTYAVGAIKNKRYPAIDGLLAPLLATTGGLMLTRA